MFDLLVAGFIYAEREKSLGECDTHNIEVQICLSLISLLI